jgi:hypothetical protein
MAGHKKCPRVDHWNARSSGFRMYTVHTVDIRKPDRPAFEWSFLGHFLGPAFGYHLKSGPFFFPASLDRFGIKNILFITLFFIKWSRLILEHDVRVSNGPTFKCPGPVENDHLKPELVRVSDAYCSWIIFGSQLVWAI